MPHLTPPPEDFDENPEWTAADFARARQASEIFGSDVIALLVRNSAFEGDA